MGICAALVEANKSGKGQVIDCAMTDGATSLMGMFFGMKAAGIWENKPFANMLTARRIFMTLTKPKTANCLYRFH